MPDENTPEPNGESTDGTPFGSASSTDDERPDFPVVGIGASAGGLAAFTEFLEHLPEESGMAFVLVQHLDPNRESELPALLQRATTMQVRKVEDNGGMALAPNTVYVIPPARNMTIEDGQLHLSKMTEPRVERAPIDLFFRSLAESQGADAVGIVLSGTGSGGTTGLKRIKERGGITLVQSPKEAEFGGMPRSAEHMGMVDVVAPVRELAEQLLQYREARSQVQLPSEPEELPSGEEDVLSGIFTELRTRTGHDFSNYKRSTVLRRIERRMQVHHIKALSGYLNYLREHEEEEAQALFEDLLITVTNFFRDEEAFRALREEVLPTLFEEKGAGDTVRVWAAGCATGEEAYSLAILLREHADTLRQSPEIQVFGTDLGEGTIATAREGFYPKDIAADLSEERLKRFFEEKGNGYRVGADLREPIIFAQHNLMNDPPFSRLDLVVCRNLLIYLKREVQRSVFEVFHYALRPSGYLFLGSAESAEEVGDLFRPVDKDHRIYRRRDDVAQAPQFRKMPFIRHGREQAEQAGDESPGQERAPFEEVQRRLLEEYAPPGVIVNERDDIVHVFKGAGRYLRVARGMPTHNVLETVRSELRPALRSTLFQARSEQKQVRSRDVEIEVGGRRRRIRVVVRPVEDSDFALVRFEADELADEDGERSSVSSRPSPAEKLPVEERDEIVEQLEAELKEVRGELRSTVEEYETSMEELRASNEELQSMNEELRSTTEELETSKEELRSMNEELTTVNQELNSKNEELSRVNSDLQNLLTSTEIATLFLDRSMRVQRYTPRAEDLFNIIEADQGRPLAHVNRKFEYDGLIEDAERVLDRLTPVEEEVQNAEGRWFLMRLLPYRTVEDKIDGVVLTFVDITERKEAEIALRRSEERHRLLLEGAEEYAIIMLDSDGRVATWNVGAKSIFGYTEEEIVGESGAALYTPEDRETGLFEEKLEQARAEGRAAHEHWLARKDGSRFWGLGVMTALRDEDGELRGFAKVMRDNTERRRRKEELERRVEERTQQVRDLSASLTLAEQRERQRIAEVLHDNLQQLLYGLQMNTRQLRRGLPEAGQALSGEERQQKADLLGQMEETLEMAMEETRSLTVELSPPELTQRSLGDALQWLAEHMKERHGLAVALSIGDGCEVSSEDLRVLLFQLLRELLFNVVKHAEIGQATVECYAEDEHITLRVEDDGVGFEPSEVLGNGEGRFGLTTAQERLRVVGGRLEIDSAPGEGARVTVAVPRTVGGEAV